MGHRLRRALALAIAAVLCMLPLLGLPGHEALAVPPLQLTVELSRSDTPLPGARFSVYRVGEFDDSGKITLIGDFSGRFDVDDIHDQQGWPDIAQDMADWVASARPDPLLSGLTGDDGRVSFYEADGLTRGVYLVVGDDVDYGGTTYSSLPFLITMPCWNPEEGAWDYNVIAMPKPGERTPDDPGGDEGDDENGGHEDRRGGGFLPKTGEFLAEWGQWVGLGIIAMTLGVRARRRDEEDASRAHTPPPPPMAP